MATILFYSPFNQRSRDTESLMIAFQRQGHKVFSLSQQEGLQINDVLKEHGIKASSYVVKGERSGWWYYLRHLFYFVRYCWTNKIDVVYSHLEPANFVASIGQYLIKARTFLCRHHLNEAQLYQFDKDLYYRITYRLAKRIIVVSEHARKYMISHEKIPAKKIIHINLAYDFSLYSKPKASNVEEIRKNYHANVVLLSAGRFTVSKRPDLSIQTLKQLIDRGIDAKLIILGRGEMLGSLEKLIAELKLENKVFMPGYVGNMLEYMAASDFFLHPSLIESSCVVIKEAGLVRLPVVVCRGVGDFDDFVINGQNGFIVEKDKFVDSSTDLIVANLKNRALLDEIGERLNRSVLDHFSIENVIEHYNPLNSIS